MNHPSSPTDPASSRDEEQLLRFIETLSEYAVFLLDAHGNIRSWNQGAERIKGWTAEEIIGQHFSAFYLPADRDVGMPQKALSRAAHAGEYGECGYRLRKNGTRFFANVHIYALYDRDGNVTGYGKITRDITETSDTEMLLHASETRLRSLIETIIDGVITINAQGIVQSYNQACVRLFGYEPHEVIGQNVSMLMPEPYHSAHDSYIDNYRRTGNAKIIGIGREVSGKRKDGTIFPIELAVGESRGNYEHKFVGIIRDISDRKEAENAKEQLRQSQRMEAIGQLTGGIAHDFNNLLAIIIGNLDFMQEKLPVDDPLLQYINPSIQAAEHGSDLTQQLLTFGRKQALQPETISVNSLLVNFTTFIRHMLGERVQTSLVLGKNVWDIRVDPGLLQNALINLSVNARDAMADGGKLIFETSNVTFDQQYVENNFDVAAGDYVMIAVSDTGSGMDKDTMEKAFEPFFTTKDVGKGTGLGLSMVYGFIKQSNGHIKLYSETGFGTSVKLYLPRTSEQSLMREPVTEKPPIPKPHNQHLILVVEDNPDVLTITSNMLETLGYRTITATSGDEAIEIIRQHNDIDLLLSDVMLPGILNGPSLAKEAIKIRPRLKVLFNSGYAEQALHGSGLLSENIQLISKPFRKMQLASKIAEILDH